MTEINIPFDNRFYDKIATGKKTWTSRNKRYGHPGDYFYLRGTKYYLIDVVKLPLGLVAEHFEEEGFESKKEFIDFWVQIHPRRKFNGDEEVFVHIFHRRREVRKNENEKTDI